MSDRYNSATLANYNKSEVVKHFAGLEYLTPCELLLFDTYLKPGMSILDLGVGGGRTTARLSKLASLYVGVDYAEEMIRACRTKFPELQFVVADASDLSHFANASFDAVVFSFNGLDHLGPDKKRQQCLQECHRVLRPGGVFIFSSHNPRALFVDWTWNRERSRMQASKIAGTRRWLFYPALATSSCWAIALALLKTSVTSIPRALRKIPTTAFWAGRGYVLDPIHGGLLTHCAVPRKVVAELADFCFDLLRQLPEDYPEKSRPYGTRWFYYAFQRK